MRDSLLLSFSSLEDRHWWFRTRREIVLDALLPRVPTADAAIADVGCGTGGLLRALRVALPDSRITGVEPNVRAAAHARQSGCPVHIAQLEKLPFEDASLDIVVALDVLEHCADDLRALQEAARVVRPEGLLLLTVPALPSLWSPHDELNGHYRRYGTAELTRVLTNARLQPIRLTYLNTLLLPAEWTVRTASRLARRAPREALTMPPAPLNAALRLTFCIERRWLQNRDLPIGMSLLAIATPSAAAPRPTCAS